MLSKILQTKRSQLTTLAEVWLAAGAKTFSIWNDTHMLVQWPADGQPGAEQVAVPIQVGETDVGSLQVTGLNGSQTHTRLTAEAAWLAQLIKFEDKFSNLTSEPPAWQNQLLKVAPVIKAASDPLEIGQALRGFLQAAQQAIQAEGAFISLDIPDQPMVLEQYPPDMLDEATVNYFFERMEADGCQEIVLDRKNAPRIVPPEMNGVYLSAIPIQGNTILLIGFLLKQSLPENSPHFRLVHEIMVYTRLHLRRTQ